MTGRPSSGCPPCPTSGCSRTWRCARFSTRPRWTSPSRISWPGRSGRRAPAGSPRRSGNWPSACPTPSRSVGPVVARAGPSTSCCAGRTRSGHGPCQRPTPRPCRQSCPTRGVMPTTRCGGRLAPLSCPRSWRPCGNGCLHPWSPRIWCPSAGCLSPRTARRTPRLCGNCGACSAGSVKAGTVTPRPPVCSRTPSELSPDCGRSCWADRSPGRRTTSSPWADTRC